MLELDFKEFMDVLEVNRKSMNEDRCKLHYLHEKKGFTLYLKSVDMWEYFTTVPIDKISVFGEQYEVTEEQAIRDFKRNFLYDARPLKEHVPKVLDMPEEINKELGAGLGVVEESDDYETFLTQKFTQWETKILSFVDRTLKDEFNKEVMTKSFGDFLSALFNNVNTIGFRRGLIATVKASFKTGIEEVEGELNIDIGFSPDMMKETTVMADRQLEGFYIEGKRWKGIKGVADDVQKEVSEIVRDGVVNRTGTKAIKEKIQDRLEVTKGRATAIARTETTRFINHSKIKSYQESGLVEFLEWDAFLDNRTSPECKHLDKQRVSLGKFWTLKDGTEIAQPPAHVNCRSIVRPILKKG